MVLIVLGSLAVAIPCAAVLIAGVLLSRPVPSEVAAPPAGLTDVEAVRIPSGSGAVLSGWWAGGEPGGGCVVLMHGVRRDRRTMARRAEVLRQRGFTVLLFDFQAHGASPGRRITFGRLEALDAAAAVAFARGRLPHERLGVIGVSLGGAAALLGPRPLPVDALVLESVFPDLRTAFANRLRARLGPTLDPFLTPVLLPVFGWLLPPVLRIRPGELRPIDRIASVNAPVLLACGTRDISTTIAETEAMFARAPEPKQFWAARGAAHVNLERYDPDAYWRVVLPFLTRYVQPAAGDAAVTPARRP